MTANTRRVAKPAPDFLRARRRALLIGCAVGAAALFAVRADEAEAQAFQATPETFAGTVGYDRATPGVETVTINSDTAIIDWTTFSDFGPYDFLPAGNVATFTNGANVTDFVLLNRISSFGQVIEFNGTVISELQQAGGAVPGGTLLFSNPNGIIVSPTAVFDVGNLILTTLNVVGQVNVDGVTVDPVSADGGFEFNGGGNVPSAAIEIESGALVPQISASPEGSYVALVAPQVVQGGNVRVNGSVAYVAAEAARLLINQGLFDIFVDTGTTNTNPILHGGSTTGPASTGPADVQGIYMVAVPKNQAIQMLLSGTVGFDATTAGVVNGEIILSAGFNVEAGAVVDTGVGSTYGGSIVIQGGDFTSNVFARADGNIIATSASGLNFDGDLTMIGNEQVELTSSETSILVSGDLAMTALGSQYYDYYGPMIQPPAPGLAPGPSAIGGVDVTGGNVLIDASGGSTITVSGNATLDASGVGDIDLVGDAGFGQGGSATINAIGGSVAITGDLTMRADGSGAVSLSGLPAMGGEGYGGEVEIYAQGGDVTVGGNFVASANGAGSDGSGGGTTVGAAGIGGQIELYARINADIVISGTSTFSAIGTGGDLGGGGGTSGGNGGGGGVRLDIYSSAYEVGTIDLGTSTSIQLSGTGGVGPNGGRGDGGDVRVEVRDGVVSIGGTATINADGAGGDAGFEGGTGGLAVGGSFTVFAYSGERISVVEGGAVTVSVVGTGGDGADRTSDAASDPVGTGGLGFGGTAFLRADAGGGTFDFGPLTVDAGAVGGDGGAGGVGVGGNGGTAIGRSINIGTFNAGSSLTGGSATFDNLDLSTSATGGAGGGGTSSGNSGNAFAGAITLSAAITPLTFGNATLDAVATTTGGPGQGGAIVLSAVEGGDLTGGDVSGRTTGAAAEGASGSWDILVDNSAMEFGSIELDAGAPGLFATAPESTIELLDGTLDVGDQGDFFASSGILVNAVGTGAIVGDDLIFGGALLQLDHSGRAADDATIDVGNLTVNVESTFTANEGTTTRASETIDVTAALATVGDLIVAPDILIASRDIDITDTGFVGGPDTDNVTLRVIQSETQPVIGGDTDEAGYTLTNAEANRLAAATFRIEAPQNGADPARPPDVLVRDLSLSGLGAASGRVGTFELFTPGTARVVGEVSFTAVRANDRLVIRADDRVEIYTPDGSIVMTDAQGQLGGLLQLFSANIVAANPELAAQLAADPNFAGRTEALRTNTGAVNLDGYLRAGGVGLFSSGTVFIQNTGTATDFAGITVGGGGLIIGRFAPLPPGANPAPGDPGFSFVGQLMTADEVLLFEFTVTGPSTVTLITYSYAGGTNAAGQEVEGGGFDPILALFNAVGTLIDQNDDGGSNVPPDPSTGARFDTYLEATLEPGDYTVAVSVYPNFAIGPTLADGFEGATTFTDVTGSVRTPNFAFDVLGADSATGPGAVGDLDVVAFGRRINADGSVTTGDAFFNEVNFQLADGVTYTELAEFNTCLINVGCGGPEGPEVPELDGNPPTSDEIQGTVQASDTGLLAPTENNQLVDTSFSTEGLIEEPVTSGGDASQWSGEDCDRDDDGDCDADDGGQ